MTSEKSTAKDALRQKYDRIGSHYSSRFRDPTAVARRYAALLTHWGTALQSGATVLEIGCADGLVTEVLAEAGFVVTAVDLSPVMVTATRRRIHAAGLKAQVTVGDIDELKIDGQYDAVLAVMRTFFAYASDPRRTLTQLAEHTRSKLLVDVNPRSVPLHSALAIASDAGFQDLAWHPLLVPQGHRVPRPALAVLSFAEHLPMARSALLRWRGNVVIRGEQPRRR